MKMASTIQLCLTDEVMYNVMDEETTTKSWSMLEILYMTKKPLQQAISQEITICATHNGGTSVVEHLNLFNKVISELLAVDVKIDEKDKALILLSSLPESYDHIVTTMLYSKETLILEEVTEKTPRGG